jgi:hypothetical protein
MLEKIKQKDKGLYYLILFFTIPLSVILIPFLLTLSKGWMIYWFGVLLNLIFLNSGISYSYVKSDKDKKFVNKESIDFSLTFFFFSFLSFILTGLILLLSLIGLYTHFNK